MNDRLVFIAGKLSEKYNKRITVKEAVEVYGLQSFDYAMPQDWFDDCLNKGFHPGGRAVWCYDRKEARIFGEPFFLTYEGEQEYRQKVK